TRGTDAHNHLPAAVAGKIYNALSPRFGTLINFQVAESADDETPARDKKAAALDEEAKETKAATEAEEKAAEATAETTSSTDPAANPTTTQTQVAPESKSKVKATVMPVETRPKTVATPAKPVANNPNQRKQPDQ